MALQDSTCRIEACGGGGDDCLGARLLDVDPGTLDEPRSYVCQKGHCANGTIVHNASLDKFFMCRIASESGVNFLGMGNDTWYEYPVGMCTDLSENAINSNSDQNATLALKNDTAPSVTFRRNSTGTSVIQAGADICLEYVCNEGYKPNAEKTVCVEESQEQQQNLINNVCQQYTGEDNTKCLACLAASTVADWDANAKQCKCKNSTLTFDYTVKQCKQPVQPQPPVQNKQCSDRCAKMTGDKKNECLACCKVSNNVATWDYNNNSCNCVDTTKRFDVTSKTCVPKEGGDDSPEVPVTPPSPPTPTPPVVDPNVALRASLTVKINTAITNLNTIKSGFDVSRWKSADGTFNTSRLVSDSVAGVVLGTAGGLITSNVIKKNQVKNGFEDISCTVGGQVVAGWDDQFSVGIR